jgi:flagellar biosynthesis/type III secretory pathway chaperone
MSTNDHIDHLLALTEKLAHCLEQETAMLRTRRSDALAQLQREKTRLTQAYEGSLKQLKEGQVTLGRIEPHRFQALTDAAERLQQVLVLNERALRAAKAVNERILTAMVDAIEIQRGKPVGYTGRGGRPPAAPLRRAGMVSAVTIDQRF